MNTYELQARIDSARDLGIDPDAVMEFDLIVVRCEVCSARSARLVEPGTPRDQNYVCEECDAHEAYYLTDEVELLAYTRDPPQYVVEIPHIEEEE